ncbi:MULTISPECIES: reverse transcriptase domain-containing protein [Flavobacterium]|uniref:reverse transcriptase domain-containing protein n=1 Tax=Flavobacterium TaxID=237 RepID=UPI0021145EDC|nr:MULTISPECIES: reverse transcriptase domain-containing protein [Flavobacterium]UUF15220.1 reverse transcriptase domain-containing protein [Flavobacterium panici]
MNQEDIYLELSNKLFEVFYVDDKKYGRQQKDGSYKLVKEKISPVTIEDMLKKQKSLLTYQELHIVGNALIKWICIDLDIQKKEIDKNEVNYENLKLVKAAADEVCVFLDSINVPYLLEFSGRRGFHIWVVFEKLISKESGFRFINFIVSKVKAKFNEIIIADKFPKTAFVNPKTKGVGFGIKLPLSQNKGNNKLSFFLEKNTSFEFDQDKWLSKPNDKFLENQLDILSSLKSVSLEEVQPFIDEYNISIGGQKTTENFLRTKKINSFLPKDISLEKILEDLRKCEHLYKILYDYEKGLGGKERAILVGLLGQLKTNEDSDFGFKILMELFSNIQNFNSEITERNLQNLKYFQPITCSNFGKCSSCNNCNLISPIQLIDSVDLVDKPSYSIKLIDENLFEKLKNSIYQYSLKNDEVPLYPQLRKSSNLTLNEVQKVINNIYDGNNSIISESYSFKRNEINKVRTLYNLDPLNNFISTYFTFILNTFYYTEISNNSYGYQFSGSLYQNNIFNNWFANWAKFSKEIEKVLFSEEYEDFYVIKLDIKSFYDKIDLKRLKIKLYEESPSNIREKLNDLSDEDKLKYKHIVNYLIDLSINTINNGIGLPQGPAYARYLAELYLNGLDNLIEKTFIVDQRREFYNRFVDDIFIFVESKERAFDLYEKIKDWLTINNLELNSNKTVIRNVREYAESHEYHRYKDNVKYDINYANKNKNVLSEEEIQNAISSLDALTDDSKFGLKDNLRFFYNQFKGDKRLDFIRAKLSKKLPFSIDGRGTLYMIFYADLIANFNDVFWNLANKIDEINGLSFTHYLNTILLNEDLLNENLSSINNLIENCVKKENISDADKLLIASICVKCNLNITPDYASEIMYSALETPNMKYTIKLWSIMYNKLSELVDKDEFLKELERIIYDNTYEIEFLNKLSDYSFLRFTEWKTEDYQIENNDFLKSFYHCLCFLTLFFKSENSVNLEESWSFLLKQSTKTGKMSDDKHQFSWVTKILTFDFEDFSNGSYLLILSDKNGSKLSEIQCQNNFLESYKEVLLMILFSKGKKDNNLVEFKKVLSAIEEDEDSLFLKWVNDSSVDLFPHVHDINICLKNIALNGLIVLKKSNKFFIKSVNKDIDFLKYDYLNIIQKDNNKEVEYEFEISCLSEKLRDNSLLAVLQNINNIILEHKLFAEKYKTNHPVFYYPAFDVNFHPVIPFYSDFDEVIDFKGKIVSNTLEQYWENLHYLFTEKFHTPNDIKLTSDHNDFNFNILELNTRFFPDSKLIVNSINDKIEFLKLFISYLDKDANISIFEFQYYWSCVVYEFIKKLKNNNQDYINFLKVHFDLFTKEKENIDIFFSINDKIELKDNNLYEFFKTIKSSINIFQSEVSINRIDFIELLDSYIPQLFYSIESEKLFIDLKYFELINIDVKSTRNRINGTNNFTLVINDNEINEEINIYLFSDFKREFEIKKIEEIETILKKEKIFSYRLDKNIFLYHPENEILYAYKRINERKELHKEILELNLSDSNLGKLFPENKYYKSALNSFETFSEKISLVKKLGFQYNNDFEIKERVVNWLSIFNEKSIGGSVLETYMDGKYSIENLHQSILVILEKHISMDNNHISFFRTKLEEFKSKNPNIEYFLIKNAPNDQNGLFRLMEKAKLGEDRNLDFEKVFNRLCTNKVESKELVIISDIFISGNQFEKAIKNYYFKDFASNEDLNSYYLAKIDGKKKSPSEEKYYNFIDKEKSEIFKSNFRNFEKISFLSPIMTENFKEVVRIIFKEFNVNSELEFICIEPSLQEEYLFKNISFNRERKALFDALLNDVELLYKLFKMNSKSKRFYAKSLNEIDDVNLIFRLGSLTKKHIQLFTLEPKKGKKILDYIKEWE